MRHRIDEPLTLSRLARELGRQCEYLGWLFRQQTGRAFHDRMTTLRLRRARRLLRDGEKVEAVVLLVGYRSKKNFYAQFRRRFALTPGEYRDRVRRGEAVPDGRGSSRLEPARREMGADGGGGREEHPWQA